MHTQSALLLGAHHDRRLAVAEELRGAGFVVVETATVHRAEAILRHLQFDVLVVDSYGPGYGLIDVFRNLRAAHSGIVVLLCNPWLDSHSLARLASSGMTGSS